MNFDEFRRSLISLLSRSVVKQPTATIVEKKGNVSQVVWSTASLVSLIIHSTGWEDNSKLMNGPIEPASDVPICYLPGLFVCFFFGFFTHSCVNNCTDLSRVKTELTVKEDKCCCPFIRDIYITVLAPVD